MKETTLSNIAMNAHIADIVVMNFRGNMVGKSIILMHSWPKANPNGETSMIEYIAGLQTWVTAVAVDI